MMPGNEEGLNMKKLLFLLPVLVLLGCPFSDTYRVYYHGNSSTAGKVPVDSKIYREGDTVTVKGKGDLKKKDNNFMGWRWKDNHDGILYNNPGDKITINDFDINLYAVWEDGSNSRFSFIVENGEVTVTGLNGETAYSVDIPDTLQDINVTAIDDTAFISSSIAEVRLPKYLKRIGAGAFAGNRIKSITIPDAVETIGSGAFRNNSLTKVAFGTGLTALEAEAFYNNELAEIVIPENIKTVKTGAFAENDIIFIRLGPNVDIQDDTAFGKYGEQFRTFYNIGKTAGRYQYNDTDDIWE
jgi:hypothetical protein